MNKKYTAPILFICLMCCYFFIRYLRSTAEQLPDFIRFHLTDLLFVPTMSIFALIILRFLRREPSLRIHWSSVTVQVILVCLYFEWYLPRNPPNGHKHTADIVDCIMYALGGIIFVFIQPFLTIGTKKSGTRYTDSEM